jgi:hypothetical protein
MFKPLTYPPTFVPQVKLVSPLWGKSCTGQNSRRSCGAIAQRTVRTALIVVLPPQLRNHSHLLQGVEEFPIQQLITKLAVKALDIHVLPGTARFNEQGLGPHLVDPFPDRLGGEFRPVVRAATGNKESAFYLLGRSVCRLTI